MSQQLLRSCNEIQPCCMIIPGIICPLWGIVIKFHLNSCELVRLSHTMAWTVNIEIFLSLSSK